MGKVNRGGGNITVACIDWGIAWLNEAAMNGLEWGGASMKRNGRQPSGRDRNEEIEPKN